MYNFLASHTPIGEEGVDAGGVKKEFFQLPPGGAWTGARRNEGRIFAGRSAPQKQKRL